MEKSRTHRVEVGVGDLELDRDAVDDGGTVQRESEVVGLGDTSTCDQVNEESESALERFQLV